MSFFLNIERDGIGNNNIIKDKTPIVLIDCSYSTECKTRDGKTILEFEIESTKTYLMDNDIEKIYLMFWSSSFTYDLELQNVDDLDIKTNKYVGGCTLLGSALAKIPEQWLNKDTIPKDLYIITDGEVEREEILPTYIRLLKIKNFNINIFVFESNISNYNQTQCNLGKDIYKIINENNLFPMLSNFLCFNLYHKNGYKTVNNQNLEPGLLPYKDNIFKEEDLNQFLHYVRNKVLNNPSDIDRIQFDIMETLRYFCKNKNLEIQKNIVRLFSTIFEGTKYEDSIYDIFFNEISDSNLGRGKTYHEYIIESLNKKENNLLNLYNDESDILNSSLNTTFLLRDETKGFFMLEGYNIFCDIRNKNKVFKNCGYNFEDKTYPYLPIKLDEESIIYVRHMLSKIYNTNPYSTFLNYQLLFDNFVVQNSNLPRKIKNIYSNITKNILKESCSINSLTKNDFIREGNYLYRNKSHHLNILNNFCKTHKLENINASTLWLLILSSSYPKDEIITQFEKEKEYLNDALEKLHVSSFEELKQNLQFNIRFYEFPKENISNYYCFISLENTEKTGGYLLKSHTAYNDVLCSSGYVLTKESFDIFINQNDCRCPICYNSLTKEDFEEVGPKSKIVDDHFSIKHKDERLRENHENITIDRSIYDVEDFNEALIPLDDCDFKTGSYNFDIMTIHDSINNKYIKIKSQEKFNNKVYYKYPFLKNILENYQLALAGGFCRAILLNDQMKDFDFFLYGYDNYEEELVKIIKNLEENLIDHYENLNIKFFTMYKPLFNVLEIICIKDENNILDEQFVLDYFDVFKFRSLNVYNKAVKVDAKNKRVNVNYYRKNQINADKIKEKLEGYRNVTLQDLKNYFEDDDSKGVSMLNRFQFVMAKHDSKEEILRRFDNYPSKVLFDGKTTYFTNQSVFAYKYMINIVNEKLFNIYFDQRLCKYFSYGFSLGLIKDELYTPEENETFTLNDNLEFDILKKDGKMLIAKHNSHIKKLVENSLKLERKAKNDNVSFYKSYMFCSLVSIMRYAKINSVPHLFGKTLPQINNLEMNMHNEKVFINFIDIIKSRVFGYNWYPTLNGEKNNNYEAVLENVRTYNNTDEKFIIYADRSAKGNIKSELNKELNVRLYSGQKSLKFLIDLEKLDQSKDIIAENINQDNIPNYRNNFIFQLTTNENVRNFFYLDNLHTLHNYLVYSFAFDKKVYINEIIKKNSPCKPYLDIEWQKEGDLDRNSFLEKITNDIKACFLGIKDENILILESSDNNKNSYHIIINYDNMCYLKNEQLYESDIKNNNGGKGFSNAIDFPYMLLQLDEEYYKNKIDLNVYTSNREFRMIYSTKSNSERTFYPVFKNEDSYYLNKSFINNWSDYLVTPITENINIIKHNIDHIKIKETENVKVKYNYKVHKPKVNVRR